VIHGLSKPNQMMNNILGLNDATTIFFKNFYLQAKKRRYLLQFIKTFKKQCDYIDLLFTA